MVTLTTADKALKSVYLGVVSEQLNINANPLLAKIKQSSNDVWGKEVIKLAPFGLNGGVGAGTEDGSLPKAGGNNYVQFISTLKNLYGTIEISDKAIRASNNNAGAFVNLLNAEMEGLIKASSFNLGRMLYGNGTGKLAQVVSCTMNQPTVTVESIKNLVEGMIVDVFSESDDMILQNDKGYRIIKINRTTKQVTFNRNVTRSMGNDNFLVVQNSMNQEITGLGAIFDPNKTIYGLSKTTYDWLKPYVNSSTGEISDIKIQTAIDSLEELSGSNVDFITCSSKVKRAYQAYLQTYRRNVDVMDLAGGYKAISYNGIPLVSDRFIEDDEMYLLNTKEFTLHQLCDWQWLESDNGSVIHQNAGYPTYNATLVKYAELICDKPNGQAKLSGITITGV